ncbi:unnamed protein product [Closterium sp. NIES-53]
MGQKSSHCSLSNYIYSHCLPPPACRALLQPTRCALLLHASRSAAACTSSPTAASASCSAAPCASRLAAASALCPTAASALCSAALRVAPCCSQRVVPYCSKRVLPCCPTRRALLQPARHALQQPARRALLLCASRPAAASASRPTAASASRPAAASALHPTAVSASRSAALRVAPCCSQRIALCCPSRRALLQLARRALLQLARRALLPDTSCPAALHNACPAALSIVRPVMQPAAHPAATTAAAAGGAAWSAGSAGGAAGARRATGSAGGAAGAGATRGGQRRSLPLPDNPTPQQLREWALQRARPGGGGFGFLCTAQRWQQIQQDTFSPQVLSELFPQRCVTGSVEATAQGASESAAALGASESAAALGASESATALGASDSAAALGARASPARGPSSAEASHTYTLDSGTSRCFFRDCTTLTPLAASVPVSLADPTRGPVVARASTVLLCPAVPSVLCQVSTSPRSRLTWSGGCVESGVCVWSACSVLLVSGTLPPDSPLAPPPRSPLPTASPRYALPSPCLVQSFKLPASPQQNGIVERRIGLIMEWTGKVGDALVFRVWGAISLVRDAKASKLSSRSLPCVFLGIPTDASPWQFYHLRSRQVFSSQDVTFDESACYYRLHPHSSHPVPLVPLFLVPVPPPR